MEKDELLKILREIDAGIEGQKIPFGIVYHAIKPIVEGKCLKPVIYLIEHIDN